ncbi:MAG: nitroreductase family protein [Spirochaetes bacterium]|nr:nitroreductase family protein [Spirochaetota bacterium]
MKDFLNLSKKRYSVRRYLPKKVPRTLIMKCIQAAHMAPSAQNTQPWRYMVIDEEPLLSQLKKIAFKGIYFHTHWANSAPVIIVLLSKSDLHIKLIGPVLKKIDYYLLDIGSAAQNLCLQATDMGLGTCWIGFFDVKATEEFLKVPKQYKLIGLLTLGYYKKSRTPIKRRKKIEDIVWFNELK